MRFAPGKILALFIWMILICAVACKKNPGATVSHKVKTNTTISNGNSISDTLTYDSQGRVVVDKYSDSSMLVYTYTTQSLTRTFFYQGPLSPSTDVYPLNSKGMVTSNQEGSIYTYDADGHLIEELTGADTLRNIWLNSNEVSSTYSTSSYTSYITTTYTNIVDSRDFGNQVFGKKSGYLQNTWVESDPSIDTLHFSATYQFDSEGRLIQMIVSGDGNPVITTYTYY